MFFSRHVFLVLGSFYFAACGGSSAAPTTDGGGDASSYQDSNGIYSDGQNTSSDFDLYTDQSAPVDPLKEYPINILFSRNSEVALYSLVNLNTADSNVQPLSGLTDLTACNLALTGVSGPENIRRDRPSVITWGGSIVGEGEQTIPRPTYIHLPGGLGRLYYFVRNQDGVLLQVKPDGNMTLLLTSGLGKCSTNEQRFITISADGKLAGMVNKNGHVLLIRLDGTTWSSSQSAVLDVTPTDWTAYGVFPSSLVLASETLFFVTQDLDDISSPNSLYAVQLKDSARASKVPLPQVNEQDLHFIDIRNGFAAVSADLTTLAFLAGASFKEESVLVVKEGSSPQVTVLSSNVTDYYNVGDNFMFLTSPKMAISPHGDYIAFASGDEFGGSGTPEQLWIASTNGKDPPIEISAEANFCKDIFDYNSFYWIDDNHLFFAAGPTYEELDFYIFTVDSHDLYNLTMTGSETEAPWCSGALKLHGGWISPNNKYLYSLIGYFSDNSFYSVDILGLDLTTFKPIILTKGIDVVYGVALLKDMNTTMVGMEGLDNVWFSGARLSSSGVVEDLYVFNQNNANEENVISPLTQRSATDPLLINHLTVSPDGKYISYITSLDNGYMTLWFVPSTGGIPQAISSGSYIDPAYQWRSDSRGIIFSTSYWDSSKNTQISALYQAAIDPYSKQPVQLHSMNGGNVYVFAAGK